MHSEMFMNQDFEVESYTDQQSRLPEYGRVIIANQDSETIVVYQAFRPTIGDYAAKHGRFGSQFSFDRMTWIKTNFLWMMYRSEWGTKLGQEVILAIRITKTFFDQVLSKAVAAIYEESEYKNKNEWKRALASSPIRLQWDPDRDPAGDAIGRRAIQLGLKGNIVKEYVNAGIVEITNISDYVKFQRRRALSGEFYKVNFPKETIYTPKSTKLVERLGLENA